MVIGHCGDTRLIIAVDLAETGVSIEVAASQVEPLHDGIRD
jgi:hypothetical protein